MWIVVRLGEALVVGCKLGEEDVALQLVERVLEH